MCMWDFNEKRDTIESVYIAQPELFCCFGIDLCVSLETGIYPGSVPEYPSARGQSGMALS